MEIEDAIKKYNKLITSILTKNYPYFTIEDIEDIVQETFLKLSEKWEYIRSKESRSLKSWLIKTAINLAINKLRKMEKDPIFSEDILEFHIKNTNDITISKIALKEAISKLKKKCKRLIYAIYYEGFTYEEAAKFTGIKENQVGVYLNRCKKKLRRLLGDE